MCSRLLVAASALVLGACYSTSAPPDEVFVVGRLVEFLPEQPGQADVIGDARWVAAERDGTALVEGVTDPSGFFQAGPLPKNHPVGLAFLKDGYGPAVFTGETANRDSFLFTGAVYQDPLELLQDFVDEHSLAVLGSGGNLMTLTSNGGGAIVRGRVTRLVDPETLAFENVGGASVVVRDGAGNEYPVWYRDAENEVDSTATETSPADARFAAFAVVATGANPVIGRGVASITVEVTTADGVFEESTFVIDGGVAEFDFFAVP